MAGSAGAGSEDGSTAQQGFRVRLDEDPHVYEFSVHASGARGFVSMKIPMSTISPSMQAALVTI